MPVSSMVNNLDFLAISQEYSLGVINSWNDYPYTSRVSTILAYIGSQILTFCHKFLQILALNTGKLLSIPETTSPKFTWCHEFLIIVACNTGWCHHKFVETLAQNIYQVQFLKILVPNTGLLSSILLACTKYWSAAINS